jgi:GxxExxY protein
MKHQHITQAAIGAFYHVFNTLGHGFAEAVYENAMAVVLRRADVPFRQQAPVKVFFRGEAVGKYVADMIIDGKVVLELKASRELVPAHEAQLLNLLKATNLEVGILMNFGLKPAFKRLIFSHLDSQVMRDKDIIRADP